MASTAMLSSLRPSPKPPRNPNPSPLPHHDRGPTSISWRRRCVASRSTALRSRRPVPPPRCSAGGAFERAGEGEASALSSVDKSSITERPQESYIGVFIGMLALDNDPLDREQTVDTLWRFSQAGRSCVDSIMKFPGCINLVISLLRSDSSSACEAAAGLLREISSIETYRETVAESGVIEEMAALLHHPSLPTGVKEQCVCTLWNLSIDEGHRGKIVESDLLPALIKCLDAENINIKEAVCGVLSNLALNHHNHAIMVESGAIHKLAELSKCTGSEYEAARIKAKSALLEFCKDEYNKILVIEEGWIPVPLVGSTAYKSYKDNSPSWPSPDGMEIPRKRNATPSEHGADELLLGLNSQDNFTRDESKMKAITARRRQQFLLQTGAIEMLEEESRRYSFQNECQTLLPMEDGVARLLLILELDDSSAISRAASAIADASISETTRFSFKEAGAIKPLVHLLNHDEIAVRESASHALEKLSFSHEVCHVIESQNLYHSLFGLLNSTKTSDSIKIKVVNILARIFNPEKLMKAEFSDKVKGSKELLNAVNSPSGVPEVRDFVSASQIGGLVELLKTSSPSMQRKIAHIVEYLANFNVHLSAVIKSGVDSALFVVLNQRCFCDGDVDLHDTEVEEAGLAVEAASRLLTKLLDSEEFCNKIDFSPLLSLLRKILKSSIPLTAKDWVAACLVKMQLLIGPDTVVDHSIDLEVTIYEVIPRLIEQMKMSPTLEYREAAIINLKDVISKGMVECSRAVASSGGIFPLVELIDQVSGSALDAGLAILYNLSMDNENHIAIVSAGAIPVLKRIVFSQKPQWPLALNLLRTLPT